MDTSNPMSRSRVRAARVSWRARLYGFGVLLRGARPTRPQGSSKQRAAIDEPLPAALRTPVDPPLNTPKHGSQRASGRRPTAQAGAHVPPGVAAQRLHWFDAASGQRLVAA